MQIDQPIERGTRFPWTLFFKKFLRFFFAYTIIACVTIPFYLVASIANNTNLSNDRLIDIGIQASLIALGLLFPLFAIYFSKVNKAEEYHLGQNVLSITNGGLWNKTTLLRFDEIESITVTESLFQRIFGMANLQFTAMQTTASVSGNRRPKAMSATMFDLSLDAAERLQNQLFALLTGTKESNLTSSQNELINHNISNWKIHLFISIFAQSLLYAFVAMIGSRKSEGFYDRTANLQTNVLIYLGIVISIFLPYFCYQYLNRSQASVSIIPSGLRFRFTHISRETTLLRGSFIEKVILSNTFMDHLFSHSSLQLWTKASDIAHFKHRAWPKLTIYHLPQQTAESFAKQLTSMYSLTSNETL